MAEKDLEMNLDNDHNIKKRNWLLHAVVFVFLCCLSAGIGYATFFGQRQVELTVFQTQFDGTVQLITNSLQLSLKQKFAASRLLNKMYSTAAKHGYGTSYGQQPPYLILPGYQNFSVEITLLGGFIRGLELHPLVDETTRPAWESWAKNNIASLADGMSPSFYKVINTTGESRDHSIHCVYTTNITSLYPLSVFDRPRFITAYKYGICNKTSLTAKARVSGTIIGGDPRFKHWLFPLWQDNDLYNFIGVASAIFLEPHSWAGTRFETIEKILIEGNILAPHLLCTLSPAINNALSPVSFITTNNTHRTWRSRRFHRRGAIGC